MFRSNGAAALQLLALAASLTLACGPAGGRAAGAAGARPTAGGRSPAPSESELTFGPFGTVYVLRPGSGDPATPAPAPGHVVLFLSGDGGWTLTAAAISRNLVASDTLVLGVDIESYRKSAARSRSACVYAAADLEGLSKFAQLKLGLPSYRPPVLVGHSSGASLAYAALAQAPPNTFRGAIGLGFCPYLEFPKPFCKGSAFASHPGTPVPDEVGFTFDPPTHLAQGWTALSAEQDQICPAKEAEAFTRQVPRGRFQIVPKSGHSFTKASLWIPSYRAALDQLERDAQAGAVRASAPAVADLPLVEVPMNAAAPKLAGNERRFAVVISGDGGWAGLDREVAGALAEKGIPTVGWNSLDYFWQARTPDGGGADLARLLRHYLATWKRDRVLLIGYSLGADVLPFFTSRLPPDLLAHVELVTLLGPSRETAFEFHVSDWIGGSSGSQHPVLPEVHKLAGRPLLCLYGDEEDDSLCPTLHQPQAVVYAFSGAHHFGGSYEAVADRILAALPTPTP